MKALIVSPCNSLRSRCPRSTMNCEIWKEAIKFVDDEEVLAVAVDAPEDVTLEKR